MSDGKRFLRLNFPCDCVSSRTENYSDPWTAVAKNKLFVNGTKEEILNLIAKGPSTISQIAADLQISIPSVHRHVAEMLASELIRDSIEWERLHPKERYYEPNFPVVQTEDQAKFDEICRELSEKVAVLFEDAARKYEQAYETTSLPRRGWGFADITQYLYACVQRGARKLLETRGTLAPAEKHQNGLEWIFWGEEHARKPLTAADRTRKGGSV